MLKRVTVATNNLILHIQKDMLSNQALFTFQASVAVLMILVTFTSYDRHHLTAPPKHPLATPVALKGLFLAVALPTVYGILIQHEMDTIQALVTLTAPEASWVELPAISSENSVQHGQGTMGTLGLALLSWLLVILSEVVLCSHLVVFFTDILPILLGDEFSHNRVVTDTASEAVGMEGDIIDSQGS